LSVLASTVKAVIEHPTVALVTPDGETVEIDEELADLVELAWQAGCRTAWCCQDHGEAVVEAWSTSHLAEFRRVHLGWSVISFASGEDLCVFMDAVAGGGPRDAFYVRMVQETAPRAWRVGIRLWDDAVSADYAGRPPVPSAFGVWQGRVFLPRSDVAEAADRLAQWLDGYERENSPIDWDAVGWTPDGELFGM
jgi:hypothetical protein